MAYAAVTILHLNDSQKAILGCLLDHVNKTTGLCYPSEELMARETGRSIRTVERAVAGLLLTPYLSRQRRRQSSSSYRINYNALLQAWDDYKARGAAHRAPSKAADQPVKSGGSIPSKVAGKQKQIKGKQKRKPRKASPQRGDDDSSLSLPTGEVRNVGGLLARFERWFSTNPNSIPNLRGWQDWLEQLHDQGDMNDPNAQRAGRLAGDVHDHLGCEQTGGRGGRAAPRGVVPAGFEDWYLAYPKHVGKPKALQSYRAALKRTTEAKLLIGAKVARIHYADTEQKFIPMPSTWLNGERWLDEEPAAKSGMPDSDPFLGAR